MKTEADGSSMAQAVGYADTYIKISPVSASISAI